MIALDAIVPPLPVNMQDAVEVRIVAVVQVLNDLSVSKGLVRADGDWPVEPDALDRLLQKGFDGFCVTPGCQSEVDELASLVHRPPKVSPLPADTDDPAGCSAVCHEAGQAKTRSEHQGPPQRLL